MKRYIADHIFRDLGRKMVLLSGPRQVGKTFLANQLAERFKSHQYLNYDSLDDAQIIQDRTWSVVSDFLILDEIHKMRGWKRFLKGAVDTKPHNQAVLVTGSARLDTFRQSGESLAGRYFPFHLHPLSVRELADQIKPADALDQLNRLGGFPEPFLSGSETEAVRWRNQYYSDLIREDILEISRIREIRSMRLLVELLRKRVGSPLSLASISTSLQIAPNTVRSYIDILESLHVIFLIRPFHVNVARAIQKIPKVYFYDTGYVVGDEGVRLENTVAVSLNKHAAYMRDVLGKNISINYVQTKDKKEVDFSLVESERLTTLIEVKLSDSKPSKNLLFLADKLNVPISYQLVQNIRQPQSVGTTHVVSAADWLAGLEA
ncbi:ATP-binding protein [Verrucomicrobiota bacterium]